MDKKNRELIYKNKKYKNDERFKLDYKIKNFFHGALKMKRKNKKYRKNSKYEKILGYSRETLIYHIENRFEEGMCWNNYGEWHLDHIIPKSLFNYETIYCPEFSSCWSLQNLQPLWKKDNLKKYNKVN